MIVVVLQYLAGMLLLFNPTSSNKVRSVIFEFLSRSNKANSIVIIQHSRYIKLLDIRTYQILPILTDVSSAKLFSRYLFTRRSNIDVK